MPALTVEVFLSAIILGPLLTTVSHGNYFTSGEFYSYFLNIVGEIHYSLPGVFVTNPVPWLDGPVGTGVLCAARRTRRLRHFSAPALARSVPRRLAHHPDRQHDVSHQRG